MLHGGRWNHKDIAVIYGSGKQSLPPWNSWFILFVSHPAEQSRIACLEIPDDIVAERIKVLTCPGTGGTIPPLQH